MASNKVRVKSNRLAAAEAAERLSAMAMGLFGGEVVVEGGAQRVSLHPSGKVTLDIEGKEDLSKGELVIKLSWETALTISGGTTLSGVVGK